MFTVKQKESIKNSDSLGHVLPILMMSVMKVLIPAITYLANITPLEYL